MIRGVRLLEWEAQMVGKLVLDEFSPVLNVAVVVTGLRAATTREGLVGGAFS